VIAIVFEYPFSRLVLVWCVSVFQDSLQALSKVGCVVEEFTGFVVHILPATLDVIIHQERSVHGKRLGCYSGRGIVDLREKCKSALLQIMEVVLLVGKVSCLYHLAFATLRYCVSMPSRLIFRCY